VNSAFISIVERLRAEVLDDWGAWSSSHAFFAGTTWLAILDTQEH
jgi:hypothetical protein